MMQQTINYAVLPSTTDDCGKIYFFNVNELSWRSVRPVNKANCMDLPALGYGQAIEPDRENNCFYLCGGANNDGNYSLDVHRFDFNTKMWTKLANTPDDILPRSHHEMVKWGERLYIFGGGTQRHAYNMEPVSGSDCFDLAPQNGNPKMQ